MKHGIKKDGLETRPSGTATYLFVDIGTSSTVLGSDEIVAETMRTEATGRAGELVASSEDGLAFVFGSAADAVEAAVLGLRRVTSGNSPVQVRIGLHTGETGGPVSYDGGASLTRAARLSSAAHRGQILASAATAGVLADSDLSGIEFVDLGRHRLRGLSRPMTVHQVLADGLEVDFGPLRSVGWTPHNLPVLPDALLARTDELDHVVAELGDRRLVTLTGPGGIGKTRLALEVATALVPQFPDGVWFCPLAPIREPEAVAHAAGQVLGTRQHPGRTMVASVAEFCRRRRLLLVLDNCEHVLDAAAELSEAIGAAAPDARILATSRQQLATGSEKLVALRTLGVDGVDSAGVDLFLDRVPNRTSDRRWAEADLQVVERICRRLDGLPLAIELAAGRAGSLPLVEIEQRLDEMSSVLKGPRRSDERHRTMTAAIDWSYQMLDETEQRFFERLSVFAGSFDVNGAASVGGGEGAAARFDLIDLLESLITQSLVVADIELDGSVRYRLLEPVREFALDQLTAKGDEAATRDAHARFYAEWAGEWEFRWWAANDRGPATDVARELANLRAAAQWAIAAGASATGAEATEAIDEGMRMLIHLVTAQASFHIYEMGSWAADLLEVPDAELHELAPRISSLAAYACWEQGDIVGAQRCVTRAESMPAYNPAAINPGFMRALLARWIGESADDAIAIIDGIDRSPDIRHRVSAAWLRVYYDPSRDDVDDHLEVVWRDVESGGLVEAYANSSSAAVKMCRGQFAEAADHLRAALAAAERIGARFFGSYSTTMLGVSAGAAGTLTSSDVALISDNLRDGRDAGLVQSQWDLLVGASFALADHGRGHLVGQILRGVQNTPRATTLETRTATELLADLAQSTSSGPPAELDELVDRVVDALDEIVDAAGNLTAEVRIVTLGQFSVEVDGVVVPSSVWGSRQARQLVKRLVAARGRPVTRDELIELLWPDDPATERLAARLSVQLSNIRRVLGGGIIADRQNVRLDLDQVSTDLEELYGAADDELVVATYAGEFLPEDRYDDWTAGHRHEARTCFLTAARRLTDEAVRAGDHQRAAALARRQIEADQHDDEGHRSLVLALLALGTVGEAHRAHEVWVASMAEIDVAVSPFDEFVTTYSD